MLTDPKAIEIISRARQKNVAIASRSDRDFVRIFEEFFADHDFNGEVVLDLGPGQYDFARMVRSRGGQVHGVDNDPAVVELGRYLDFEVEEADLRAWDFDARKGRYDGLFCKFAVNAFWFDDAEKVFAYVSALDAMLKPGGWGWIAPWNGPPRKPPMPEAEVQRRLEVQREAFGRCGWEACDLSRQWAAYYGMAGNVANHVVFLRNVTVPTLLADRPAADDGAAAASDTKRIFVRGISRSGGTLMVTVLDAHPDVAMCYETYEHLLAPQESGHDPIEAHIRTLTEATRPRLLTRAPGIKSIEPATLRTFTARALRAGVEPTRLLELMREHAAAGLGLASFHHRMQFVERLALEKMECEGKRHWGTKVATAYHALEEMYPGSYFLFMQRDGRDIAASRKVVGDFKQSVEDIAGSWVKQIEEFRDFASRSVAGRPVHARFVNYERLTSEPEQELHGILDFLGLPWDDRVLHYHEQDLSLYRNPTGHLSAQQVNRPINRASVGRWRQELTPEEIETFDAVAGALLNELGYETGSSLKAPAGEPEGAR